jgi:hypothetical protein
MVDCRKGFVMHSSNKLLVVLGKVDCFEGGATGFGDDDEWDGGAALERLRSDDDIFYEEGEEKCKGGKTDQEVLFLFSERSERDD